MLFMPIAIFDSAKAALPAGAGRAFRLRTRPLRRPQLRGMSPCPLARAKRKRASSGGRFIR
jgi:hypothetical protein